MQIPRDRVPLSTCVELMSSHHMSAEVVGALLGKFGTPTSGDAGGKMEMCMQLIDVTFLTVFALDDQRVARFFAQRVLGNSSTGEVSEWGDEGVQMLW